MADFATVADIVTLKRALTPAETERAQALIPLVCDTLRQEAVQVRHDLDADIAASAYLASVAKTVTVDIVMRELMASTDQEPMTQISESAMGYSMSGTFLSPGGGIFIKRDELRRLGLRRARFGVSEMWEAD